MKITLIINFCFITIIGLTQNEEDALRYTESFVNGSARNIALGGSMSALGGDYSATSQNPAGMARFNTHNFSFTPIVEYNKTKANFYNNDFTARSATVKLGNISYLKAYILPEEKYNGWLSLQLGAGYKRINSFEDKLHYMGEIDSSILHSFINDANGTDPSIIYEKFLHGAGLAYDVYAIDPDTNSSFNSQNIYTTQLVDSTTHNRLITNSGGISEYSFTASGNFKNKFYIGGSININRVEYESNFSHKEEFSKRDSTWLNNIEYLGTLNTEGWGINSKIGAIFLPAKFLRIGIAIHTPTFYKLNDKYSNDMKSNTDDPNFPDKFVKDEFIPRGEFDYKLRTPSKANFSLAYIIKKKGSIAMEIEYQNIASSFLKSPPFSNAPYSFTKENSQIKNIYRQKFNFKLGGEYRINSVVYLRAGYAYYQSPMTIKSKVNTSATVIISGGFGINLGDYYFDFAIASKNNQFDYYSYNPDLKGSKVNFNNTKTTFALSVGYRFR